MVVSSLNPGARCSYGECIDQAACMKGCLRSETRPKNCTDANDETAALGRKVPRSVAHVQISCEYAREIERGKRSRRSMTSVWLRTELQPGCNPMSLIWTVGGVK